MSEQGNKLAILNIDTDCKKLYQLVEVLFIEIKK